MKERIIFAMAEDEKGLLVTCPNQNEACLALADALYQDAMEHKNGTTTNVLFGAFVHFLAMEKSGNLEKHFIENLQIEVAKFRKHYEKMEKDLNKNLS